MDTLEQTEPASAAIKNEPGSPKRPVHPVIRPDATSIMDLFAQTVAEMPEAEAFVAADRSYSFAELADAAARLAAELGRRFQPKDRILIFADRSFDAAAAMFGVLRAGMTCVPILKDFPDDRIRHIRTVAKAAGAVCEPSELARAEAVLDVPVLPVLGHPPSSDKPHPGSGEDEAYILFTSGSTGEPKGVVVAQHSVVNLLRALKERIFTPAEGRLRLSVNAPLAFDASMKQFFQAALGRTLVPVPADVRADPEALIDFVADSRLWALDVTPTILKAMIAAGFGSRPEMLPKAILVGGEAMDQALWDEVRQWTSCDVWNVYGPTEATVNTLVARVKDFTRPTLGYPLTGVSVACVDPDGFELPAGADGELQIGGAGVAIGYIGASADENAKFSTAANGARCYDSGDFVRRLPDGSFEFLGRRDDQVKVAGQRLELGEIEACIKRLPGVRNAAVLIDKSVEGDPRIVAGVVADRLPSFTEAKDELVVEVPTGHRISSINVNETTYQFKEIFEDRIYVDEDIVYPEDAVVVDVGANIGLFSLFVSTYIPKAKVYAFEPLTPIRRRLELNMGRYAANVSIFPYGLSDTEREETFTYYPGYSMMSSQQAYADASGERNVIKSYLTKAAESGDQSAALLVDNLDEVLEGRFDAEYHPCRLRRLSDVIDEAGIERIDVLKIDVQRAELDVLRGIQPRHFGMINAISMELHDDPGGMTGGRRAEITALLEQAGFVVKAQQDPFLVGTDRWNLIAFREDARGGTQVRTVRFPKGTTVPRRDITEATILSALRTTLPAYMLPRTMKILPELPRTPQGKLDKRRLLQLIDAQDTGDTMTSTLVETETETTAPRAEPKADTAAQAEKLLTIWREVLRKPDLTVNDDFFNNGGDSIRAILMQSKARAAGIAISLKDLHAKPTVAGLLPYQAPAAPRAEPKVDTVAQAETLLTIWREVLRKPDLTVNDDFFNNGGDSIRAILMQSKARAAGITISLKDLHAKPTIAGLLPHQAPAPAAPAPVFSVPRAEPKVDTAAQAETLLTIWREVLRKPDLTVNDDFFNNGGDSIRAILMQSKARAAGIAISLKDLHANPTVAGLLPHGTDDPAKVAGDAGGTAPIPASRQDVRRWPATSMQRLKLLASMTRDDAQVFHNATITPVLLPFDADKFRRALHAIRAAHPVLSARVEFEDDGVSFVFEPHSVNGDHGYENLTALSHAEQEALITDRVFSERASRFDLLKGGLVRFGVFERSPQVFEILVAEHHAALDGYSLNAIIRELVERYCGIAVETTDDLTVFAAVTDNESEADGSHETRAFWETRFAEVAAPKPFARPRRRSQPARMKQVNVLGSDEFFPVLHACSRRAGLSTKGILFALHVEALREAFGDKPSQIGVVYSLRPEVEGSLDAIGNFLNVLPVPTARGNDLLTEARSFDQFDRAVFPHKAVSHDRLSGWLGGRAEINTVFNFIQFAEPDRKKGDKHETERRFFAVDAMMPLSVDWDLSADRLSLGFQYDAERMDESLAQKLKASFARAVARFMQAETGQQGRFSDDGTRETVLGIIAKGLPYAPTDGELLADLGLHSLQMVRVARQIMDAFATTFTLADFLKLETVGDVVAFCRGFDKAVQAVFVELTPPQPRGVKARLIGFPQVGVAPSVLDPWCDRVPDGVSIHAYRYPDFNASDFSGASFDRFVGAMVKALAPLAGAPMVFVGSCFGSILAYEVARRMTVQPVGLVVIGSGAPTIGAPPPNYHLLSDGELKNELIRMKSMPEQFLSDDDLLAQVFVKLRGMSKLAASYRPDPKPLRRCELTSIWPRYDVSCGRQDMIAWSNLTDGRFTFAEIEGEHAVIMENPLAVYELSGLHGLLRDLVSAKAVA
ncbi:FkbM family methyltransferase [Azospirillum sp.]|uniref:FkbM family methyltransferase n=1 Tax=Azospirillum sp. TaxID=34012 RepID=UPI002D4B4927|nr:FkbM family methyltransferase [Azospirillum sp.]HYF89690.1 FkbM family methyltransferase [Azospirillum sp.]